MMLPTIRDATDRLRDYKFAETCFISRRGQKTYLMNICKLGKDFALIYINFEFDFLTKYHSFI